MVARRRTLEVVDELRSLAQPRGRVQQRQVARRGREALAGCEQRATGHGLQALGETLETLAQMLRRGADELGRGGGGRTAPVRSEVGEGQVDFVADTGDDRNAQGTNGPHDPLVVEGHEILVATPAAGQDQDVALAPPVGQLQGADDLLDRALSLHGDRIDDDRQGPATPRQDRQKVVQGRPAR